MADKELNLGLLSLVGEEEKAPTARIDQTKLDESLQWVEKEIERGILPKALIAERIILLAPGSSSDNSRLASVAKNLFALLPLEESQKFTQRFEAAAKEVPQQPVPEKSWISGEPITAAESWNRFANMVKDSSEKRLSEEVAALPPKARFQYGKLSAALLLLLISLISIISLRKGAGTGADSEVKFARIAVKKSLGAISEDSLVLPSLELLHVSSLSSLVSEINSQPLPIPSERASRARAQQVPVVLAPADDRLEEIPNPKPEPKVKEALSIEQRDEPAALRDIQSDPEPELKENTFEFPPFINKKPEARRDDEVLADVRIPPGGRAVIHYSRPRRYAITAATQVMARPSYWAPRLGDRDPGEFVEVDAVIGVWLRIRDEFDGAGYILAQDAVPSR